LYRLATKARYRNGGDLPDCNHLKIKETRKPLEAGKEVNFNEMDIETVASIFKLWLRELPTPLIPFTCYSKLLALGATVKKVRKEEKKKSWPGWIM